MVMVWGHRGHRHHRYSEKYTNPAYENSLAAYKQTLAHCMGVECDVIQSKQGTLYLAHDTLFNEIVLYGLNVHLDEVSKEIAGNKFIYQMTDSEINSLKLKDGQPIPTLSSLFEVMKNYPKRVLNLEIKGPHTGDMTVRAVERAVQRKLITPEQVVFTSFNLPSLRDLRSKVGHRFKLSAAFSLSSLEISPMYPSWPNAPQDASYIPFKLEDNVLEREDLRDIEPDFFCLERGAITKENFDKLIKKFPKSKIIIWTASEVHPHESSALMDTIEMVAPSKKLHAVMSDFPEIIQRQMIERGMDVVDPAKF